ncbi:hypothetical protein B0H13DRAFT_1918029 [Mycena leptocephala]|nr:hypothetical protein B0H13DRAFT_1918029 [Mycena leptocephala]
MFQNYYRRRGQLQGHFGAIYSLVATDDGKLLASGGATTAITWINRDDEPGDILVYRTINGYLVTWQQSAGQEGFHEVFCRRLTQPSEVTALAFDTLSGRLAVCTYNSVVQVYAMRSLSPPQKLFAVNIDNFVPKSIPLWCDTRERKGDSSVWRPRRQNASTRLQTFHLHPDYLSIFSRTLTGTLGIDNYLEPWEIGACITGRFFTACMTTGRSRSSRPGHQTEPTRQVHYGDDSKVIVIGSDHGIVYVTTAAVENCSKVVVEGQDWVQTIATADCNGVPTIFAAKSGEDGGWNNIVVWRKAVGTRRLVHALGLVGLVYQNRNLLEEIIRYKLANFSPQT